MNRLLVACELLIPACIPVAACKPAQLQKVETARATAEAECNGAKSDYETAKAEYAEYRETADGACAIAHALPDEIGAVSLVAFKAACAKATHLDAAVKRVDVTVQRVARICDAVDALGAP